MSAIPGTGNSRYSNIDGRCFAAASFSLDSKASIVYRTLQETESASLAEVEFRHGSWQIPRSIPCSPIDDDTGETNVAGDNFALSYGPGCDHGRGGNCPEEACPRGERFLFFTNEDSADGYVLMRHCDPDGNWGNPKRLLKDGRNPFKAHRFSKFTAAVHIYPGQNKGGLLLYCVNENGYLTEVRGTPRYDKDRWYYNWTHSRSDISAMPRADLAVVQGGNTTYVLYRGDTGQLCLMPRTQAEVGREARWGQPRVILEKYELRRNSPVAISLHSDNDEIYLTAFYVQLDNITPVIYAKDIYNLNAYTYTLLQRREVGRIEPSSNLSVFSGLGSTHLVSVSNLDGNSVLLERIRSKRITKGVSSDWVIAGGVINTDAPGNIPC